MVAKGSDLSEWEFRSNQPGKPARTAEVIAESKKNIEWILEERLDEHQFLSQDQLQQGGL